MEQKAEELYEDRLRTSQTTVFSRWTGGYGPGLWFQSKQKPVMFWKQSEGCKGQRQFLNIQESSLLLTFLFKR